MRRLAAVILTALLAATVSAQAGEPAAGPRTHVPAPDCYTPQGTLTQPSAAVSYEINGRLYCTGILPPTIGVSLATGPTRIRYVLNNNINDYYACQENFPLFLFLHAPAMGIYNKYLTGISGTPIWTDPFYSDTGKLIIPFFRNAPPPSVPTDLFNAYPLAGTYRLIIGCFSADGVSRNQGEIYINVVP
jgi:hypothetical protein